jgi:hypothetical protein
VSLAFADRVIAYVIHQPLRNRGWDMLASLGNYPNGFEQFVTHQAFCDVTLGACIQHALDIGIAIIRTEHDDLCTASLPRTVLINSKPLISGSLRSTMVTSGLCSRNARKALSPVDAVAAISISGCIAMIADSPSSTTG